VSGKRAGDIRKQKKKGASQMRKFLRGVARARMERDGLQKINKKRVKKAAGQEKGINTSFFAENWRKYAAYPAAR
jgi:hypothetical protein